MGFYKISSGLLETIQKEVIREKMRCMLCGSGSFSWFGLVHVPQFYVSPIKKTGIEMTTIDYNYKLEEKCKGCKATRTFDLNYFDCFEEVEKEYQQVLKDEGEKA